MRSLIRLFPCDDGHTEARLCVSRSSHGPYGDWSQVTNPCSFHLRVYQVEGDDVRNGSHSVDV